MQKTRVIILAAGMATRLKPLSNRIPKPLIDINGTPIIVRIISTFKKAGFNQFSVLIGYKGALVKKTLMNIDGIEISFIEQEEISGMSDAILLCLESLKNEDTKNFFVTAADLILSKEKILEIYQLYKNTEADLILSLMKSHDLEIAKGHGNVQIPANTDLSKQFDVNEGLRIIDVIEKPEKHQILSDFYSLPLYLFNWKMYDYLQGIEFSTRGEREFQDAIKKSIKKGDMVRGINILKELITINNVAEYHLTHLGDIIRMNKRFLSGLKTEGYKGDFPTFIEPVRLFDNISIGDDSLIGPNVIIGSNCEIGDYCELSNTIIYDDVLVGKNCKLDNCIIDVGVSIIDNMKAKDVFLTQMVDGKKKEILL